MFHKCAFRVDETAVWGPQEEHMNFAELNKRPYRLDEMLFFEKDPFLETKTKNGPVLRFRFQERIFFKK